MKPRCGLLRNVLRGLTVLLGCFALYGCGGVQNPPSVLLVLDGPPLFIAVDFSGKPAHGFMDRNVMAGVGRILLYDQQSKITCQGNMDAPASEKGRLYVLLTCTDGREVNLALRNMGPDQGMGVGRVQGAEGRITLFYHPSEDEARRRLRGIKADIARGEQQKNKEKETTPAQE